MGMQKKGGLTGKMHTIHIRECFDAHPCAREDTHTPNITTNGRKRENIFHGLGGVEPGRGMSLQMFMMSAGGVCVCVWV
jgi:hypothetical protein